jgi:uncharacterized protein YjbI with pentapeptide repeats
VGNDVCILVLAAHHRLILLSWRHRKDKMLYRQAWMVCVWLTWLTSACQADIYRWDNVQLSPGTEGVTPGPGVQLSNRDRSFAELYRRNLTGANLSGSNLVDGRLESATLAGADFSGAALTNAALCDTTSRGFTREQLYSTDSYKVKNLAGIGLADNNLSGWDFHGQNLADAAMYISTLTGAIFLRPT